MITILYCLGNNVKERNLYIFNIDATFPIMVGTQDLIYAG